jgi:cytidylate kinase
MRKINIAIDGPSGVGKSTIAKTISEKLDYLFINTGLMYRSISYFCIENKIDIHNEREVVKHLNQINLNLLPQEQITLNNVNITKHLREEEISISASTIASYKEVRKFCVLKQQKYTINKGVIMEGRDIGSVVIPDAELKIFLNANLSIRSQRRIKQLQTVNIECDEKTVMENILKRDEFDANRTNDPLKKMSDAIEIDTSNIEITEVVNKIIELAMERINNEQ